MRHGEPESSTALVERLGTSVRSSLADVIPRGADVALVDLVDHSNVGDHAIVLGELAALRANGHRIVHASVARAAPVASLRRRIGDAVILLHGGGNLGDLWPAHQQYREDILAGFPDHQVVQLPQSLAFESDPTLESARRAFAHPRFTLLVRDTRSLAFAREHFDCRVELTPDSAFAIGRLERPDAPVADVVCLLRHDHEQTTARGTPVEAVDWPRPIDSFERKLVTLGVGLPSTFARRPRRLVAVDRVSATALEQLSRRRFAAGLATLGRGRTVVTDRLHAHIMSLLLDIPHVAIDSRSGKVHDFIRTWTAESPLVRLAPSLAEARVLVGLDS